MIPKTQEELEQRLDQLETQILQNNDIDSRQVLYNCYENCLQRYKEHSTRTQYLTTYVRKKIWLYNQQTE